MRLRLEGVGILALGSHEELHGAALPLDTDARIASHVASEASKRTGANFLGVLRSSHEFPGINTGRHQSIEEVLGELRQTLDDSKRSHGIEAVVLVNAHGGNEPVREHLRELEGELGMRLVFNNTLVEIEGPHAATGELSAAAAIGIVDIEKLAEHSDFERFPEVGFVGLKEARKRYPWAEQGAQEVESVGLRVDKILGEKLLESAIVDVVKDVQELRRNPQQRSKFNLVEGRSDE